jgi:tRNA uridine 5-carboxymethylaminomethyl modification enzyme
MFTSRAEYRLQLREDNADLRLTGIGRRLGVVDDVRWRAFEQKVMAIEIEQERLKRTKIRPQDLEQGVAERVLGTSIEREYSLYELLRRPDVTYADVMSFPGVGAAVKDEKVAEQVEIQAKYHGYIERQREEIMRNEHYENMALPVTIDYGQVRGLSIEVQQKLNLHKPETVGQASRISGMTPAAISLLLVHLRRGFRNVEEGAVNT